MGRGVLIRFTNGRFLNCIFRKLTFPTESLEKRVNLLRLLMLNLPRDNGGPSEIKKMNVITKFES